jgi:ketosteroid isomerase-like protein
MRKRMSMAIAAFFLASVASATELTGDEEAVWKLEEAYWQYVRAGDDDAYKKLWHDDFVGWPCFEWTPTGKDGVGKWVRDIRENRWKLSYTLKPLAVKSFGQVVVVHYAAEYVYDYGDGTTSGAGTWRKFTHTWMKAGDRWQIIGGMCAPQEPIKTPRT